MFESADAAARGVRRARGRARPTRPCTPTSARARKVGRRYAELTPIVKALAEYDRLTDDLAAARELAGEDAAFAAEAERARGRSWRR